MRILSRTVAILFSVTIISTAWAVPPPPVSALAYSTNGTRLAVGSRNEVVILDAAGNAVGSLSGLPGSVTAIAWNQDDSRLAVGVGAAGKAGEVRIYALPSPGPIPTAPEKAISAHADRIHDLAFNRDGTILASCSYDRLIKLWDARTGAAIRTLKDHSDAVYGISFRPDGKLLATASADRTVKVWDPTTGIRLYSLSEPIDAVLTVAWHPDGKRLVAAGADKSISIWEANERAGKLMRTAFAHEKPVLRLGFSADGATLFSMGEDKIVKAWDASQLTEKRTYAAQSDSILAMAIRADGKQIALGRYDGMLVLLDPATGTVRELPVNNVPKAAPPDRFPARAEPAGTDSPRTAPEIPLQTTVTGSLSRAGEIDYYRIALKAHQEVGIHAQVPSGGKLDPVLILEDAAGNVVAESMTGALGYRSEKDATLVLAVRDRDFRGGAEFSYRLRVGDLPVVMSYSPLGLQRGTTSEVAVSGVFLAGQRPLTVKAPADAAIGSRIPVPVTSPLGAVLNAPSLVVGEFPEAEPGQPLAVPGTGRGLLSQAGQSQTWSFAAKKGQPLVVEVEARRLGSSLDSVIEILDDKQRPVPWAMLRCTARTTVAFRDHDSVVPGIRMDTWNEFAIDDFVMIGNEVMRIRELPRGPDDDCQFYAVNGQRLGFFGTTPSHHAMSSPMFRVGIFPPHSSFPSNGLPLVPLYYRNDDGGPRYGKDSRLRFDPPADGNYLVRVSDVRGFGGPDFGYRITVRPPRPDFTVKFQPTNPTVGKGSGIPITATVERLDDFDGPVEIRLKDLPPGFRSPPTFIEAGQISTVFTLFADGTAPQPDAKHASMKLTASAMIAGRTVVHDSVGSIPKLIDAGDIVTTTQATVSVRPGQETKLLVHVDRRNGFKGRIPLDVLGLPHGVRVLNVGLNGILVTERDSAREIVLYAEPWVAAMQHPIVVLARREGKGTEHAADSVLLKVEKE